MKRLLALMMALLLMPAVMAESIPYYIDGKDADCVHLRKEPSKNADSLGLYYTGTTAILIGYEADWAWVMVGQEVGYILREYLTIEYVSRQGPWRVVNNPNSAWVNLRQSPSLDGEIAQRPNNGVGVRVLGETADGWSYVDYGGIKGYIMTRLLSALNAMEYTQSVTILEDDTGLQDCIYQYIAPNGQSIVFTSGLKKPVVDFVDVNFDGHDDIVITTGRWAKCDTVRFYVFDPVVGYALVRETSKGEGLMNYVLYPEYGLVGTHIANGSAGAEHESCIFRWEGNDLKCIRRAYSETYTESVWHQDYYTVTTWPNLFVCNVYDYTTDVPEGEVVFNAGPMGIEEYLEIMDAENAALWQGLK